MLIKDCPSLFRRWKQKMMFTCRKPSYKSTVCCGNSFIYKQQHVVIGENYPLAVENLKQSIDLNRSILFYSSLGTIHNQAYR